MAEKIKKEIDEYADEIAEIVGHEGKEEKLVAKMNIVVDKKQYSVRIPTKFAKDAGIKNTDKFEFRLIPPEEENGEFNLIAKLKRG